MNLIAIIEEHLWLLAAVNGGVVPRIEEEVTFLLVDPEVGNTILTAEEARKAFPNSDYIDRFTK